MVIFRDFRVNNSTNRAPNLQVIVGVDNFYWDPFYGNQTWCKCVAISRDFPFNGGEKKRFRNRCDRTILDILGLPSFPFKVILIPKRPYLINSSCKWEVGQSLALVVSIVFWQWVVAKMRKMILLDKYFVKWVETTNYSSDWSNRIPMSDFILTITVRCFFHEAHLCKILILFLYKPPPTSLPSLQPQVLQVDLGTRCSCFFSGWSRSKSSTKDVSGGVESIKTTPKKLASRPLGTWWWIANMSCFFFFGGGGVEGRFESLIHIKSMVEYFGGSGIWKPNKNWFPNCWGFKGHISRAHTEVIECRWSSCFKPMVFWSPRPFHRPTHKKCESVLLEGNKAT